MPEYYCKGFSSKITRSQPLSLYIVQLPNVTELNDRWEMVRLWIDGNMVSTLVCQHFGRWFQRPFWKKNLQAFSSKCQHITLPCFKKAGRLNCRWEFVFVCLFLNFWSIFQYKHTTIDLSQPWRAGKMVIMFPVPNANVDAPRFPTKLQTDRSPHSRRWMQ